jgi:hypothetical protein
VPRILKSLSFFVAVFSTCTRSLTFENEGQDALDRLAYKEAELQKVAQMHREEVKEIKAEVAALRDETAKNAELVNEAKRNNDAIKSELAAARSSEAVLQSLLQVYVRMCVRTYVYLCICTHIHTHTHTHTQTHTFRAGPRSRSLVPLGKRSATPALAIWPVPPLAQEGA